MRYAFQNPARSGMQPVQGELPLAARQALIPGQQPLTVLDLFAGIGGFSAGFRDRGFLVTGVDHDPVAKKVYESAGIGQALTRDLLSETVVEAVPVVLGGPPCTPWSAVNLHRRRAAHDDHALLARFFNNVLEIRPALMLMENVPALGSDSAYLSGLEQLRVNGYNVARGIVRYDEFGAATKRRRLFTIAIQGTRVGARCFFELLSEQQRRAGTVRGAIGWLRNLDVGGAADHDWSQLRTISNYRHLYKSGKYGWAQLKYDEPAPSFGSVAKTYILHPEAGIGNFPERVISVREVMAIMGFDLTVAFPAKTSRAKRYQMIANAVSPLVSRAAASVIRHLLTGSPIPTAGSEGSRWHDPFALAAD